MSDILVKREYLFLASRMKRIAERMQSDAIRMVRDAGLEDMQSSFMPVFAALDGRVSMTMGELIEEIGFSQPAITRALSSMTALELVTVERDETDKRQKVVCLTAAGKAKLEHLKASAWPRIEAAARNLCDGFEGRFVEQLALVEADLAKTPLDRQYAAKQVLEIIPFRDELAQDFYTINEEWISAMFAMEATDEEILRNPRKLIVERGGEIWFIRSAELGVIGTAALIQTDDRVFELTKMGVRASARGKKAGEKLLAFILERAKQMGMRQLYLLTNKKCEAAIHLYEKLGFQHDDAILRKYAGRYKRSDVAMTYPLSI